VRANVSGKSDGLANAFEHAFDVVQDILIGHAQDRQALALDFRGPLVV
jgi:hypothetical protein